MKSFKDARVEELPAWLNGPVGRGYVGALGQAMDDELDDLKVAIVERFPALCDPAALDTVGAQYAIEQFRGEADETYRARVLAAWETWENAGLRVAIIDSLRAYGLVDVEVYELNAV